jgi:hypothetical protein
MVLYGNSGVSTPNGSCFNNTTHFSFRLIGSFEVFGVAWKSEDFAQGNSHNGLLLRYGAFG